MIRWALFLVGAFLMLATRALAAPPPIEAYGRLPAIEHVNLSPSGERIAYIGTDGENRTLFVTTTDGKMLRAGNVSKTKVRDVAWAGDDHVVVTVSATVALGPEFTISSAELVTVVVLNVQTGKTVQVFTGHQETVANLVSGRYGTAQVDGHWYGWYAGHTCRSQNEGCADYLDYSDLYRVDLDTGELRFAAHGRQDSDDWLVGPDGTVLARSRYSEKEASWKVLGKEEDQVLGQGQSEFGGAGALTLGRSADTVLVDLPTGGSGGERGDYEFKELSLNGAPVKAMPDIGNMRQPLFDPVSHLWIGQVLPNDEQEPVLFSPALEARWRGARKAFPNYIVHLKSWNADFSRLIVKTEGGDDSGTYWLVDIAKHSAATIGAEYPAVKPEDVGPVRMVDWKAADGLALRGVLTLPPGREAKALPLIVMPHGGPEARDHPGFDWWAQAFAGRGYAVFQPNFRGSIGYGIEFRNAGLGQWGRKMQTDISDGVAELAKQGIVDPRRACIVGDSYGGYAALAGVTIQQGLYRCAVSVSGVANPAGMLIYTRKFTASANSATRYWKAFMGVDSSEDDRMKQISPVELADHADAPILLIHGKDDTRVPIDQSETMERALKRAGKPVDFVVMGKEDHFLSRGETRMQMLKAAIAFVEKNNPAN